MGRDSLRGHFTGGFMLAEPLDQWLLKHETGDVLKVSIGRDELTPTVVGGLYSERFDQIYCMFETQEKEDEDSK